MDFSAALWTGSEWFPLPGVLSMTLSQDEGQIDSLVVSLTSGGRVDLLTKYPSAPIVATADRMRFSGYLDIGQPHITAQTAGLADTYLQLLGVPHVMRTSRARSWWNTSPMNIVTDVIAPYKLGLEMDYTPLTYDFASQSDGESDWALLSRMADGLGFSLTHHGGIIRLLDVSMEVRRAPSRSPQSLVLPKVEGLRSNISSFRVSATTTPSGLDYRDTVIYGVDRLNQRFSYRTTFEPNTAYLDSEFTSISTVTCSSLQDAVTEARRINQQARFTFTATAVITGYLPIEVGRHVYVVDNNGTYTGWWYCMGASYAMAPQMTMTTITLGKSARSSGALIDVAPSRQPQLVLHNGHWQLDRAWRKIL